LPATPAPSPDGVHLSDIDVTKLRPKVQLHLHGHTGTRRLPSAA
jgi:hypothetical protein